MAATPPDPRRFTATQRAGLDARNADQDRTLAAVHVLEAALSRGAYGRVDWWHEEVLAALGALEEVTAEEAKSANQPDSLLSDIAFKQPRLRNRVRGLRTQSVQLRDAITALRREMELSTEDDVDVADIRHRLGQLLATLRHHRARESDLIYEAYYDAFERDIEDGRGADPY
jgi:hypothetical protein